MTPSPAFSPPSRRTTRRAGQPDTNEVFGAVRGALAVGVLVLAAGCGGGGGSGNLPLRDSHAVAGQVAELSTSVMGMTRVTGKTTPGAPPHGVPSDISCDVDDGNGPDRQMLQSWSLYGVGNGTLGTAMARLAADLPEQGWKVVRHGPDSSANRNQEIVAVHVATKAKLDITWQRNLTHGEPLILFYISSSCFREPVAAGSRTAARSRAVAVARVAW